MRNDAFSKAHPAVSLAFFLGAVCFGALFLHPAYQAAGLAASALYCLLLRGRAGWRLLAGLLPAAGFLALINPVLNPRGATVLFRLLGRPYTLEALIYGACIACVFASAALWLCCLSRVLTGDRLAALFGGLAPTLCLLLVMTFRLLPGLFRKAGQIGAARGAIGKGTAGASRLRGRLSAGMTTLGALASWALEGGIVTGDSMRARGYGVGRRTGFRPVRMTRADRLLLAVLLLFALAAAGAAASGGARAAFFPRFDAVPLGGAGWAGWARRLGFAAYCGFLLLPSALHLKEEIQWNISKSAI